MMNPSRKNAFLVGIFSICCAASVEGQTTLAEPASNIGGFPNTPEGAYIALVYAMAEGDEVAIRAVTVNTPGLGRLLETTRVPAKNLSTIRDHLLKRTDIRRLAIGDTVRMAGGEIYAVKSVDVNEGRAIVREGIEGTMPIRCRLEEGRWKVDARLIIANRRVAGQTEDVKAKKLPHRDIMMPSPLTGPPYPNTPEGAYRTFLVAYLTADAPNLHAIALPRDGFDVLLKRPPCSFDQATKYQADLDRRVFKVLKPGDSIDVGGRKITVSSKEVSATRALIQADLPGSLPVPCEQIAGKWWVDPRPLILSLKVEEKAKAAQPTTSKR